MLAAPSLEVVLLLSLVIATAVAVTHVFGSLDAEVIKIGMDASLLGRNAHSGFVGEHLLKKFVALHAEFILRYEEIIRPGPLGE